MNTINKINEVINGNFNLGYMTDILSDTSDESKKYLFEKSAEICEKTYGDGVFIRGIIEMSNICIKDCEYCGIRKSNTESERYRMEPDEIVELAAGAYNMGYRTLVLQSGEEKYYDDKLPDIIKRIKQDFDMALTISIGEKTKDVYKAIKDAGADRYLLRIETTDPDLYRSLHPDGDLENRIECLHILKELGYEVGTGIMIGLPNQTIESIAKDILFFREIDADMIGMGPFIPHHQTPLKDCKSKDFDLTLRVLALTRIVNPTANIPATTSMGSLKPGGREEALKIAANVIMPNYTPQSFRKHYQLYDNKICVNEGSEDCRVCIDVQASKAGKRIIIDKGFRKK